MIKRFFAREGIRPIAIGTLTLISLFFVSFFTGLFYKSLFLLILAVFFILLAFFWAVFCTFIEERYIYPPYASGEYMAFQAKDGEMVTSGKRFWKEKGYKYFRVGLPKIEADRFEIETKLEYRDDSLVLKVPLTLFCLVEPGQGFVPQELYLYNVLRNAESVEETIKLLFEEIVNRDPQVQMTFEECLSRLPSIKIGMMAALMSLPFDVRFSNIAKVEFVLRGLEVKDDWGQMVPVEFGVALP